MDSTVKMLIAHMIQSGAIDAKTGAIDTDKFTGNYTIKEGRLERNAEDDSTDRGNG